MKVPLHPKLEAARWRLIRGIKPNDPLARPYLAAAVMSLIPAGAGRGDGTRTVSVDQYWRVYWNDAWVDAQDPDTLVAVMYHEVCHLLRRHHARLAAYPRAAALLAADLEINDDLQAEGYKVDTGYVPGMLGLPDGLLAEEYARLLGQQQDGSESQAGAGQQQDQDAGGSQGGSGGSTRTPSSQGRGQESGQLGDHGQSGGAGVEPQAACGGAQVGGSAPKGARDRSAGRPGPVAGADGPAPSGARSSDADRGDAPAQGLTSSCGSGAHGQREPWEYGPDEADAPRGLKEAEQELIKEQVARAIQEAEKSRGHIPAAWRKWAESVLAPPTVPWWRVLRAVVRRAVALASGRDDYSYSRPSRRQGVVRVGDPVRPANVTQKARVAVVIDVSGSMTDDEVRNSLAEVVRIIRDVAETHMVVCDADVHEVKRVVKARDLVWEGGGGGTDMRVGIERALETKPQVVVVFTDGETPWPSKPPTVPVVVALTAKPQKAPPSWAKVVEVGGRS